MDNLITKRIKNREKQSALRQRRKDYVELLEYRLRELERKGVTATEEVQAAARQVDAENALLRCFIREGMGYDKIEDIRRALDPGDHTSNVNERQIPITPRKTTRSVSVAIQTDPVPPQPIHLFASLKPTTNATSGSTIPCASAFRMIRSVNFSGKDMAEIIVQLSPGFSLAAYKCCGGHDGAVACTDGGSEGCVDGSGDCDSGCVVDSRTLFKVLDDISEI